MPSATLTPQLPPDLYPRVLGDSWWLLPEPVRLAHAVGGELHGRFKVTHGSSWIARRLARWSRLPHEADSAETVLRVSTEGEGERWDRRFDGVEFSTCQWMSRDGHLVERFNEWELEFALRTDRPALVYQQLRARLCLGPLRFRVPLFIAPRVRARETGVGATRVNVEVHVSLPLIGLLIAYDGHLDVEAQTP